MPASTPVISHGSRTFSSTFNVSLTMTPPSGGPNGRDRFYYTLDGTTPTLTSFTLSGPSSSLTVPAYTHTLTVLVYNEGDGSWSSAATATYTFSRINNPPQFDLIQSAVHTTKSVGQFIQLRHLAVDDGVPNQALTYSIVSGALPTSMTLDTLTGVASGTPSVDDTYIYTVRVSDGELTAEREFTIEITAAGITCPLSAPFNQFSESDLDSLVSLGYNILRRTSEFFADVRISWNRMGVADTSQTILHVLEVREGLILMQQFPIIMQNDEAYKNRYSVVVKNWDLRHAHTIDLTINCTYKKTISVPRPPVKFAERGPLTAPLDYNKNSVTVRNTGPGIEIKLKSCQGDIRRLYKNVRIRKATGNIADSVELPIKFARSVEIPLEIGSVATDYPYIVKRGNQTSTFTNNEFQEIYTRRKGLIVQIRYEDLLGNFIEVTDQAEILNTPSEDIITVNHKSYLDKKVHNDMKILYYTTPTNQYWRYRDNPLSIPFQSNIEFPDIASEWIDYIHLDRNYDNQISVPVPGYLTSGSTGATVKAALRNPDGDYTGFSTRSYNQPNLAQKLNTDYPGVTFMQRPCCHMDTDVSDGSWYTYQVDIETWTGQTVTLYRGKVRREEIKDTAISDDLTLESLETTARDEKGTLSEYDFQSGIGRGISVFLSDNPDDAYLYEATKGLLSGSSGDCGCKCEDC